MPGCMTNLTIILSSTKNIMTVGIPFSPAPEKMPTTTTGAFALTSMVFKI